MIKLSDSARLFYTLASIILVVVCMYYLRPLLAPLSFSFILSVILLPPTMFLERRGLSPTFSSIITVMLASLLLIGAVVTASWQVSTLTDESAGLTAKLETHIQKVVSSLEQSYPQLKQQKILNYRQRTQDLFKKVGDNIGSSASGLAAFVANALLLPLFIFFMLAYRQFFRKFLHTVIPRDDAYVDGVLSKIYSVTRSYLSGMLIVMGIVAVLNTIGLTIIGVPYAIFFAMLASLLMVIPYLGVFVGSLLPCVLALVTFDSPWPAVAVAGWMWGVQLLEGNFITPNLVGSKVSINPFAAIISLIAMGQLWGIAGLVLAIPFIAILKIIFDAVPSTQPYGMLIGEVSYEEHTNNKKRGKKKTEAVVVNS